jgi:threonine dehydrogenase-like Zn-dependent dehydrogenase
MGLRIAVKTMSLTGLVALLFAGSAAAAPMEVVANGNDSGAGSLREAIAKVDPGGTIVIPASVTEIALNSELVVNKSLTIEGGGSSHTAINGQRNSRVLKITDGSHLGRPDPRRADRRRRRSHTPAGGRHPA